MPPTITLTFRNGYRINCESTCYCHNSQNWGCICAGRNTGIGLDKAIASNTKFERDITKELFQRFPHAAEVKLLLVDPDGERIVRTYQNPHPIHRPEAYPRLSR